MKLVTVSRRSRCFFKLLGLLFLVLYFSNNCHAQIFTKLFRDGKITGLDLQWDLVDSLGRQTFRLDPYKPIYFMPSRWSSSPNQKPVGQNPGFSANNPVDLDVVESTFQVSFKTKVAQGLFKNKGDLWVGYTQLAAWQIYNRELSRAFREINHEPEVLFNYPLDFNFFGFRAKMAGVALNHESNGQTLPLSRSWNRIIFHFAMEKDDWQIMFRPWYVIKHGDEDNPDADDFIGRAELTVIHAFGDHMLYAVGRHPLNRIKRGSLQLNYIFPISGNLRGHLQFFSGYGETMIDYRHYQNTFGIGISLIDW